MERSTAGESDYYDYCKTCLVWGNIKNHVCSNCGQVTEGISWQYNRSTGW